MTQNEIVQLLVIFSRHAKHYKYCEPFMKSLKLYSDYATDQFVGDHEDEMYSLLPHHLPEVGARILQRALAHHVVTLLLVHRKL